MVGQPVCPQGMLLKDYSLELQKCLSSTGYTLSRRAQISSCYDNRPKLISSVHIIEK